MNPHPKDGKGAQPEQLVERAKALSAKATPGPWQMWAGRGWPENMKRILGIGDGKGVIWPVAGETAPVEDGEPKEYVAGVMTSADQAFIAAARQLVPALATALSECRKTLEQIADPSYVGNYSEAEVVEIYRKWATNRLGVQPPSEASESEKPQPILGPNPMRPFPGDKASERSGTRPWYRNDGAPGRRHYV